MLTATIRAAMKRAHYELEEGEFFGDIPGLQGVLATVTTLEACRDELESVLEGWILLGLRLGHELPELDGLNLNPNLELAA